MKCGIIEASRRSGIPSSALRYYVKMGLLSFVDRDENGYHVFKESDFEYLGFIQDLKSMGVSLEDIKLYIDYCVAGHQTTQRRVDVLSAHREKTLQKIREMQDSVDRITQLIDFYEESLRTTDIEQI